MKHVKYGIVSITPNHNKLTFRLIHIIYNIRKVDLLGSHGVRWGWSPWLQVIHGMPFIEARTIRLNALLIVTDPVMCEPSQKVVVFTCLGAHLMQSLQSWPEKKKPPKINNLGTNKNSWVIQQHCQQLKWWCLQWWHMNSKLERMKNKAIMAQLELLFQHFPEGEKLQEISSRMDSLCTQKWTQDCQKDWYCRDHDIQWRQLISGSEIPTHHSHKYNYNGIHQNKRTFWFNLQQNSTRYNICTSHTAYREMIPFIRGVVSKFPDWIFRAHTECSYHTSRYRYYPQGIMG